MCSMPTLPAAGTTPYKVIRPSTTIPTGPIRTTPAQPALTIITCRVAEAIHQRLLTLARARMTTPVRPLPFGKTLPTNGKDPLQALRLADHQDQRPFRRPHPPPPPPPPPPGLSRNFHHCRYFLPSHPRSGPAASLGLGRQGCTG